VTHVKYNYESECDLIEGPIGNYERLFTIKIANSNESAWWMLVTKKIRVLSLRVFHI